MNSTKKAADYSGPILIVDDDVTFAQMLQGVIASWHVPHAVHHLLDGSMLLDYLTVCFTVGSWNQPLPALIILDVNMPNFDGVETMKWLKKSGFDHLRVVIATGEDRWGLETKLKKHGAQHFISKPFEPADYDVIRQALKTSEKTPQGNCH